MTEVVQAPRSTTSAKPDLPAALLRYLSELIGKDYPGPADGIAHELARQFGARGAGVAFPSRTGAKGYASWSEATRLAGFPWQTNPERARQAIGQPDAGSLDDADGSWLLWAAPRAPGTDSAVLWLNANPGRHWSEAEAAALALAGQILQRVGLLGDGDHTDDPVAQVDARLTQAAQITSRLTHDFGNQLTGILGFTELALAQVIQGTLVHRYLSEVWGVGRTAAEWLKKLSFFCRRQAPEFTPTGLAGALAEEQASLGAATTAPWVVDVPADLPAIACDTESLREALRQVLDNAREATADAGKVSLTARTVELDPSAAATLLGRPPTGRYVEVLVADDGPGLSPDARKRLFRDLFFSSKPRHRGLGLTVTYGILRCFGGGLRIDAGAAGGTEVRLYFPAAADPVPAGPARLLLVDDDPRVLAEARRVLEPSGYRLTGASSAAEALVLHQTVAERFELILTAIQLPHLTGPELARRIRLRDPQARFLFLHTPTAAGLPRDEMLSPDVLVHKPFTPSVLLQAVAAILRRGH